MVRASCASLALLVVIYASNVVALAPPALDDPSLSRFDCDEETVFGTFIVVDEERGIFGLLGTRYKFLGHPDLDVSLLLGRDVRIEIGRDCVIEDIRVLDGDSETITQVERD